MNGVHDMGGMHGFGPIRRDDAPFHAPWELRVRAMMSALIRARVFNIDEFRRAVESIPPAKYLAYGYFERWLTAIQMLLDEKGALTSAETDCTPTRVPTIMQAPARPAKPAADAGVARFRPDDRVRARNEHFKGHTRLPRYARGKQGVIHRVRGVYAFADTNAHGLGPHPQPVYSVRFAAMDLWGQAAAASDSVYIDLWESYLEPL
ncbi:MAG: nitrile hydratase subunit beta [bacterium]